MKLLEIKNLDFGYNREKVLKNIDLTINGGEFIALVGSNGAGKTTFIKLILGELKPNSGTVNFNLENGFKDIGYVPQLGVGSSYNFPITVRELLSLPLKRRGRLSSAENERIEETLKLVGIDDKIDDLYSELSGGQRQRVLIAKALIAYPKFLILDEPTNGIDHKTKGNLYNLLHHINKAHGITILIITHELDLVREYLDRVYMVEDGQVRIIDGDI